ncbi:MAG: ABC transporter substrate-binding protein [Chloroflexota bacterium]
MSEKRLTRRNFLLISALSTSAAIAAACGPTPAPTAAPTQVPKAATAVPTEVPTEAAATQVPPSKYNEAPMLAEMVQAGTLPPVDQRLPKNPLVVQPEEEVGQYGGVWRWAQAGFTDWLGYWAIYGYVEPWIKFERKSANGWYPNMIDKYEWNADDTELTIHYREGMRWSDGEPVTVDDWLFFWNDMVNDTTVALAVPLGTNPGGETMKVDKVDDFTLKFTFSQSNPLFLEYMSRGYYGSATQTVPAHYMKQFHPKYNTDLAADQVQDLISRFNYPYNYPDMPSLMPWKVVEAKVGEKMVLERNPYYWKVDSQGNQLPYLDGIDITIMKDPEVMKLKAIAGEIDCQFDFFEVKDVPMLKENQEKGDYRLMLWPGTDFGWPILILGYANADTGLADLFYDQKFRIAMSVAINRTRINELTSLGLATPRQAALSKEAPEFQTPEGKKVYDEWAASYAAHDPEQAKALLDEIGLVDVNGDSFRERADGSLLELIGDVVADDKISVEAADLIREDFEAVGLKLIVNAKEYSYCSNRALSGESQIWIRGGNAAWGLISATAHWTPIEYGGCYVCPPCGRYFQTGGKEGVPARPGSVLEKLQQAYSELIKIVDPDERTKELLNAYRLHIDEGPVNIGTVADHPVPVLVKNSFRNVPDKGLIGPWDLGFPGTSCPEQFFMKQS